jgi:fibronectin type 3 domain-containing protein
MGFKHKVRILMALAWLGIVAHVGASTPAAPTQLKATTGNTTIGLVWSAPAGTVNNYVVYANLTPIATQVTAPQSSYLARGLNNGTLYTFTVVAENIEGQSPQSASVSAVPAVLPHAPTGLTATAATGATPQIQLNWTAAQAESGAISGYAIYRSLSGVAQNYYAFASATSFVDSAINTLNAFGTYYYQVAAVDQWGNTGPATSPYMVSLSPLASGVLTGSISATPEDGQIFIYWSAPTGMPPDGYQINLVEASNNSETTFYSSNTYVTITAVPNNGELYYLAVSADYLGTLSNRLVTTTRTLPPTPQGLTAFSGNNYVLLNWNPVPTPAGVTTYRIYADTVTPPAATLTAISDGQSCYINHTASTLYYSVTAINDAGESPLPLIVNAIPGGIGSAASPPTNFTVSNGTSQTLKFSWTANPTEDTVTGYKLYALDGPFVSWTLPDSATTTTVAGLTNGQSYRFFLTAMNAGGESPASLTLTTSPLAAPGSFNAQAQGNSILLTWTEGDNPSGVGWYHVYRTNSNYSSPVWLTSTAQTGHTDAQLSTGSSYYRLSATNTLGQWIPDALSSTATAVINVPPFPPDLLKLTPGDAQVQILWRKVTNHNSYNLYRSLQSGNYSLPILTNIPAKESFLVDSAGLTNTSQYFYTMTAVNDAGESTRSAQFSAIPYKPASLPADSSVRTAHERRQIILDWNASITGDYPIVGYNIYRSTDGGGTFIFTPSPAGVSPTVAAAAANTLPTYSYADMDVTYGSTYFYRLHALDYDSAHQLWHEGPSYSLVRVRLENPDNRLDVWRNAFNPARGETVPIQLMQVQPGRTWIKVYNLAGEHICTLWDQEVEAGYSVYYPFILNLTWDGKNSRGETVASGVYVIHVEGQSHYHQSRKVAVIK